ncbi:MAG: helix-turn-helix domain-containing protein [Bacillota bacterium]
MNDNRLVMSLYFLGASILIACFFLGYSIMSFSKQNAYSTSELHQKNQVSADSAADMRSEDILSFSQAAVYLGVDEMKLHSLVEGSKYIDGKGIPYYKIGAEIRFSKKALCDWNQHSAENHLEY